MRWECLYTSKPGSACSPGSHPHCKGNVLNLSVEEEPGEEGEEDAEGTAAESARAEGTASQGEGQDNVIPNGKEEEEEGKASTMKEAECDAAGEADGMAAPLGLAQFGSVAQAGKEAAEGDPGPGQQVMAS